MISAPGKSYPLGLPPAAFAFLPTACHNIGSSGKGRLQSKNVPTNRIKPLVQETGTPNLMEPLISDIPKTKNLEENHIYADEARQENIDDIWFRSELKQQETFDSKIEVLNVDTAPAVTRVNAYGFVNNPDMEGTHDMDLFLNDEPIETVPWGGQICSCHKKCKALI